MKETRLKFGLGIKRISRQWNVEYSSHSGSEMHGKNYVAVNTITSENGVGKNRLSNNSRWIGRCQNHPLKAWQIIKYHRHYRIYQHVKPNLSQTLQIMMKRIKRREYEMKIWKNLKTAEHNLKIAKTIEVKMSCVDAKNCMETVGFQEQFNISTKKWKDTEFCTMMTVRIT